MKGHLKERSPGHWVFVRSVTDPVTGKRKRVWHSFRARGIKEARIEKAKLIASITQGSYIEPTRTNIADFVATRINQWEANGNVSARSAARYRGLLKKQIAPHLGLVPLQRLSHLQLEAWHTTRRNCGLAARTIGFAHRLLGKALSDAERDGLISRNVSKV